jgi:hypothetical protein
MTGDIYILIELYRTGNHFGLLGFKGFPDQALSLDTYGFAGIPWQSRGTVRPILDVVRD